MKKEFEIPRAEIVKIENMVALRASGECDPNCAGVAPRECVGEYLCPSQETCLGDDFCFDDFLD